MLQSRNAYFGLGAFGSILVLAIACGNDRAAPNSGDDADTDSDTSGSSSSGGTGTGGTDSSSGTGGQDTNATSSATNQSNETITATAATNAAGGSGGMGPVDTGLGDPCNDDGDCEEGWTCIPPDEASFQIDTEGTLANFPGGICTKECTDAYECWEDDEWSVCLGFTEDVGYCMPYCIPGDGIVECGGRTDMVCGLLPTGENGASSCSASADCELNQICAGGCVGVFPVCLPNCATDAHCPEDYFCDPATGACLEDEPSGAAVGEACSEDADCASNFCGEGICTRTCTFDVDAACGTNGLCFPAFDVTTDPGDFGRCWTLCDCADDCANDTCLSFQDQDFEDFIGYAGFCGEALSGDVELACD